MTARELKEKLEQLTEEQLELPVTYFDTLWLEYMEVFEVNLYGEYSVHLL